MPVIQKSAGKADLKEYGGVGTPVFAGALLEEYLTELQGTKAIAVYDKMRRSDAQVKMSLRAVKLPILGAKPVVKPSEDDKEKGEVIASFIERNLVQGLSKTWSETLRHILLHLEFGFMPMEKCWEIRDRDESLKQFGLPPKVAWLRKLDPRMPATLFQWEWDGSSLTGMKQQFFDGKTYVYPTTPIEKLAIFTCEKEGNNWEGISFLRSAYKHWFIKDHLEKIDAMGHERGAMGVPVWKIPADIDPESERGKAIIKACQDISQHLQANERGFVVEVSGTEFRFEVPGSNNEGLLRSVEYHNRLIAVNILAQFMELGNTDSGSRAVATEQRGPFDLSLLSIADEICGVVNRFIIPEMVQYNYGPRPGYPELDLSTVSEKDIKPLVDMVCSLVEKGVILPSPELDEYLREKLDLPERPKGAPEPGAKPEPEPEPETKPTDQNEQPEASEEPETPGKPTVEKHAEVVDRPFGVIRRRPRST